MNFFKSFHIDPSFLIFFCSYLIFQNLFQNLKITAQNLLPPARAFFQRFFRPSPLCSAFFIHATIIKNLWVYQKSLLLYFDCFIKDKHNYQDAIWDFKDKFSKIKISWKNNKWRIKKKRLKKVHILAFIQAIIYHSVVFFWFLS